MNNWNINSIINICVNDQFFWTQCILEDIFRVFFLWKFQILNTSSSAHTHLGTLNFVSPTPVSQQPVTPRQHQVVSIRDNPCFDQNTTNIVNNSTLPNDIESTTGKQFLTWFYTLGTFQTLWFYCTSNLISSDAPSHDRNPEDVFLWEPSDLSQ